MGANGRKAIFITGAASGMGRETARLFHAKGWFVGGFDVNDGGLASLRDELGAENCLVRRLDVTDRQDYRAALKAFGEATGGKMDILYNNAGIFPEADRSVVDTDEAVWDRVLAVNVKGVYLACKYGIPAMLRAGGGSIVNIASFVALVGCSVPQDAYTASKGAVIALTRSLAVQFAPQGIRTNAICPGPIETPLLTSWLLTDPEAKALRLARNPTGRFGRPEDIVNLALYLASDESSWTNGAIISADGGITANYF